MRPQGGPVWSPPANTDVQVWSQHDVISWFGTLPSNLRRHSQALLPAYGRSLVDMWDLPYLSGKGLCEEDVRCLLLYRNRALGRGGGAFLPQLRRSVDAVKSALRKIGPSLPFPGNVVANLLLMVVDVVEGALANRANLVALRDRALALLDVLLAYSQELLQEERKYKQAMEDFKNTLQHIVAYAQKYASRNWVMRMLTVGRDAEECGELLAKLRAVYDRVVLAVAVDSNALLQEATRLLRQAAAVQDPGAAARALVEQLGGMEAVRGDPSKMGLVVRTLDVGTQVTIEAFTALFESHLDNGPQQQILQAELRLLWRKHYPSFRKVPWPSWWTKFPACLPDAVPGMDPAVVEELVQLLAGPEARAAFEQAVEADNNPSFVSVWELQEAFSGGEALLPQVRRLLPQAIVACSRLPPLPEHYTGREEEAAGLEEHLRAHGSLALLGGGGMGKSCLAADVARRLVRGGHAPGGALWVDLRKAISRTDVEARFCTALGLSSRDDNGIRIVDAVRDLVGPQPAAEPGASSPSPIPLAALLVVDNAEDALAVEGAAKALRQLLRKVLYEVPSARLLITSRVSLPIRSPRLAERRVGPLSPAAAAQLVQDMVQHMGEMEGPSVAEACQCVPVVLCLMAKALVAGQMTYRQVLDVRRLVQGVGHPNTASSLSHLAVCTTKEGYEGRYAEAELLYRQALELRRRMLGEEHPDTASSLYNLATCIYFQRRYTEAGPLYRQALELWRWRLGEEHPGTTVSSLISNLAECLKAQGCYTEAEPLYRQALELRRRMLGEEHPDTASSLHNLATCIINQFRYTEAEPLYRQALELRRRVIGEEHPGTALTLTNLATCIRAQGCYAEAEPLYRQALGLRLKLFGEEHPNTASSLSHLAACVHEAGRYTEAEPLYRQALELRRRMLGEEHLDTASSLHNLAICIYSQGRYAEAEPLHRQVLELRRRLLGAEHLDTAISFSNLATCIYFQRRYTDAEPLYRQALRMRRRRLGEEHPDTAATLNLLATCVRAQGRAFDPAIELQGGV